MITGNYQIDFSLPLRTATEPDSVKQSPHRSVYSITEAYTKDRAPYPFVLIFGTTTHACTCHLI